MSDWRDEIQPAIESDSKGAFPPADACLCPDPYCPEHARCVMGHELIILPDDPAFCPDCGHDVMPRGACGFGGAS